MQLVHDAQTARVNCSHDKCLEPCNLGRSSLKNLSHESELAILCLWYFCPMSKILRSNRVSRRKVDLICLPRAAKTVPSRGQMIGTGLVIGMPSKSHFFHQTRCAHHNSQQHGYVHNEDGWSTYSSTTVPPNKTTTALQTTQYHLLHPHYSTVKARRPLQERLNTYSKHCWSDTYMAEARTDIERLPGIRKKSEEEAPSYAVRQLSGYLLPGRYFGAKHKWR